MPRIGRKIVIAGITGLALAAGIGVVSAQASPSTAVATPAPTPDNITSVTAEIGVAWADAGDVSYVAKGRNIKGTSVSYDFSAVNDEPGSTGRPCPVDIALSGTREIPSACTTKTRRLKDMIGG